MNYQIKIFFSSFPIIFGRFRTVGFQWLFWKCIKYGILKIIWSLRDLKSTLLALWWNQGCEFSVSETWSVWFVGCHEVEHTVHQNNWKRHFSLFGYIYIFFPTLCCKKQVKSGKRKDMIENWTAKITIFISNTLINVCLISTIIFIWYILWL